MVEATYFVTFSCYGLRLHGDPRGSADRDHNTYGTPLVAPHEGRLYSARRAMVSEAVTLSPSEREVIHGAILALGERRGWNVHALNVRSTHVHAVVWAPSDPRQVIQAMKAGATRALTTTGHREDGERIWARGGSKRYLWNEGSILRAVNYVLFEQ